METDDLSNPPSPQPCTRQDFEDLMDKYFNNKFQTMVDAITKPLHAKIEALEKMLAQLTGTPTGIQPHPTQNGNKKNVIIFGLMEDKNEAPTTLYGKVTELATAMGLPDLDFDDARRLGKPTPGKTRPVLLQLLRTRDKWTVFSAKKTLWTGADGRPDASKKFAKISINEDMSKEERKTNADLRGKLKDLRKVDKDLMGIIRGGILITKKAGVLIHKFKWTPTDIQEMQ